MGMLEVVKRQNPEQGPEPGGAVAWRRLPWPLWLCFAIATQHVWALLMPLQAWLPTMAAMLRPLLWLWPLDVAALTVLAAGLWRGGRGRELADVIWSLGRLTLLLWYVSSTLGLIIVHWQVLNDPDRAGFGSLVLVLGAHLVLLAYLLLSRASEDAFADPLVEAVEAASCSARPAVEPDPAGATRLPPGADTASILRRCAALESDDPEILACCQHLLVDPEDDLVWHDLALALLGVKALDLAANCLERTVFLCPRVAVYQRNLGELYRRCGRLDDALASTQTALVLEPDVVDVHYNLGVILGELGRLQGAIDAYQRALAIDSEFAAAWHNLAVVFDQLGEHEQAQAAALRAGRLSEPAASVS
jgi:tetratricopeptide (TPR) repeat protein